MLEKETYWFSGKEKNQGEAVSIGGHADCLLKKDPSQMISLKKGQLLTLVCYLLNDDPHIYIYILIYSQEEIQGIGISSMSV